MFDKLVTRCLPSVASTRQFYIEKLSEVISQMKTKLTHIFDSAMNARKGGGCTYFSKLCR
jgi:hypothetical protein